MTTTNEQSSREQELRGLLREWQQAYNRMDDVGVSVADFQSLRRRTHEALSSPTAITAEEAGREGEAKDAARYRHLRDFNDSAIVIMAPDQYGIEHVLTGGHADELIDADMAALLPSAPAQSGGQEQC